MSMAQALGQWSNDKKLLTQAHERGIIVDEQDTWLLTSVSWFIQDHGHAAGYLRPRDHGHYGLVYLHHMIMGCPIWKGIVVDHINRDPADNRRANLRWVTHAENLRNNDHPLGQTGKRGTTVDRYGRYLSRINWNGTTYHLGTFATLDEAVIARDVWIAQQEASHG